MKKRYADEQIIRILQEAESRELPIKDLCKRHNITEQKFHRWRCGSGPRLPGATQPNSAWSYDFVHDQLVDGRVLKMLCVIDKCTRDAWRSR
ncbi:hypothetical protein AFA_09805 [Alcaligenes faecalis]|jgi:hypothetical protein|uniref:Transposase n=1 Tax=Alcaligenes faecalis TaxID=511 RepID=A0AB33CT28_ALCFA|nr:hypothetical protein AFA_09805 [Alcaligenes faecalis]